MNSFQVKGKTNPEGYSIDINNRAYSVKFDREIWQGLRAKEALFDNIIYGRTALFRIIFERLSYNTSKPFLKGLFDWGIVRDMPKIADIRNMKTQPLLDSFSRSKAEFADDNVKAPLFGSRYSDDSKALLGMSFGKDCFLTFGLAQEIGLDVTTVFFSDMQDYNVRELEFKKKIMQEFIAKFSKKMVMISDNTDSMYYDKSIPNNCSRFDEVNAMTLFALNLLPLANATGSRHIMFGNEHNHNDTYTNDDGFRAYPSGDQASDYMKKFNEEFLKLTGGNNQVMSLVEPLYNIAEIKILGSRYPQFLPLIMSCASNDIGKSKWCSKCPMCAKFYVFSLAVGIDVSQFTIQDNMLRKKYWKLYPLFNDRPERAFEKPKEQRDEQLLMFYLAYKNSAKGELIDLFREKFLEEAKQREEELRKKFFGIHESASIPAKIKKAVVKIYREELADLY